MPEIGQTVSHYRIIEKLGGVSGIRLNAGKLWISSWFCQQLLKR